MDRAVSHTGNEASYSLLQRESTEASLKGSATWLPYTLRPWYHALVLTTCFVLYLVVCLLCYLSIKNYGLATDDGSSALLFGWRFTPTLIAVFFAQLLVMQFDDVLKTEPYARMARPGGATASMTVLNSPPFWWNALGDGLSKKKNGGSRGWTLVSATLAYMMAVLAISPLSSSLLTSQDVVVPYETAFIRTTPGKAPLNLQADRNVYLRTANHLLRNLTTSPWISNTHTILPFSPENQNTSYTTGVTNSNTSKTWTATTRVLEGGYSCKDMSVIRQTLANVSYVSHSPGGVLTAPPFNGTTELAFITLSSDDGCVYNFDVNPHLDVVHSQSVTWTTTAEPIYSLSNATYLYTTNDTGGQVIQPNTSVVSYKPTNNLALVPEVGPLSPFMRFNQTEECLNRDLITIANPWFGSNTQGQVSSILTNFTMRALLCTSSYNTAELPVTASLDRGAITVSYATDDFDRNKSAAESGVLNASITTDMLRDSNWTRYVDPAPFLADNSALLLAAMYGYNTTTLLRDKDLAVNASAIRSRFFGELVQSALAQPGNSSTQPVSGQSQALERRVVVVSGVGITMAVLFFLLFWLLVLVYFKTGLAERPLNLRHDPATILGIADFLSRNISDQALWRMLFAASRKQTSQSLRQMRYITTAGHMLEVHPSVGGVNRPFSPRTNVDLKLPLTRRPIIMRLRTLLALCCVLVCYCAAVIILMRFANDSRLYQSGFVYQAQISILKTSFSFAPFSIIPTLLAVVIGLWWDALDKSFRALQPYVSQTDTFGSTLSHGAGLSYRSSYWVWAAAKALTNKHWLLAIITFGSCFCQIFTVSTSALFEIQPGEHVQSVMLNRTMEMRQVPLLLHQTASDAGVPYPIDGSVWESYSQGWMFSSLNQLVFSGSQPSWSRDGWSFIPLNVSTTTNATTLQHTGTSDEFDQASRLLSTSAQNVTIVTPAIRGRVECTPLEEFQNKSLWLISHDLTNVSSGAKGNLTSVYTIQDELFQRTHHHMAFQNLAAGSQNRWIGCQQELVSNKTENISIGYWSGFDDALSQNGDSRFQPNAFATWPMNFTAYWMSGSVHTFYASDFENDQWRDLCVDEKSWVVYTKEPSVQALNCKPIIEAAEAEVVVDQDGDIQSYHLGAPTAVAEVPWMDGFIRHNSSANASDIDYEQEPGVLSTDMAMVPAVMNVTTSYGVLFFSSLIYSSMSNGDAYRIEDRDQGLSTDLMTYTMYTLGGNDADALLDASMFLNLTERTFQTFFQHFVSRDASALDEDDWAYQKIGSQLEDIGPPIIWEWNKEADDIVNATRTYPILHTNRTAEATISTRVELLHMNAVATWITVGILCWLILTTVILTVLEKKYLRPLRRNVECLADVMVLIAGSDNLMQLVETRDVGELKKNDDIRTRLGWFRTREGDSRWGIEVMGSVEGSDAVQWIETHKA